MYIILWIYENLWTYFSDVTFTIYNIFIIFLNTYIF